MMKYLAGVLTVIAVGVLLVAYGLLGQRAEASFSPDPSQYGVGNARQYAPMQVQTQAARPVRTVQTVYDDPPVRRPVVVERAPRRDWKKSALVIGGSSATGAGVGAIFGGKKGALIGAAIGGGASSIFEASKR
jgi:hypothetical protein